MPIVPVIDLDDPDDAVATALDRAYSTVGFCYLANHGVDPALVAAVFDVSHRFHALPEREKRAIAIGPTHRGYIAMATSTIVTSSVAEVRQPNRSESLIFGRPQEPDDPDVLAGLPLAGVNQWPNAPADLKPLVLAYQAAMEALGLRMAQLVAVALGADRHVFDAALERPTTYLRLLRYPARACDQPPDQWGSAPHTDYGFLTVLAQDEVEGLQVRLPGGTWLDAPPVPDTFVMNAADLLARWSNGRWISTPHRVPSHPTRERYSVPFFYDPHVSVEVRPLPHLGQPRFDAVSYGDYVMSRLRANYRQHQN